VVIDSSSISPQRHRHAVIVGVVVIERWATAKTQHLGGPSKQAGKSAERLRTGTQTLRRRTHQVNLQSAKAGW